MFYLVYKITNTVNNKIYVGVHKTNDKHDDYMGSGVVIKRAIDKYGIDKFVKEILYECNNEDEMLRREADIVDGEFLARPDTYNLIHGGKKSWWDYANITGANITSPNGEHLFNHFNKMKSDIEYRELIASKISSALLDYYIDHENPFKSRKHSLESKQKIGKANSIRQKGEGNSNYGNVWIHNNVEKISKRIPKTDVTRWLDMGWILGRKMKFDFN